MLDMEFGVAVFPAHDAVKPGDVAQIAEERGQESLFFPGQTHMPVARALDTWESAIAEFRSRRSPSFTGEGTT
jgi:hypothetical protein